jgi:hypothetical protein
MVSQYSDLTKLAHAKQIAKQGGCFIVEVPQRDKYGFRIGTKFLLYRECQPKNQFVGKRSDVNGIYHLAKKATNFA